MRERLLILKAITARKNVENPRPFTERSPRMKRFAVALSLFLVLVAASATRSAADGPKIINANVVGGTPNVTIRTVTSGAAPWVVREGKVQLDPSGRLRIRVKGLLITGGALASGDPVPAALIGTVGPVTTVHAALTCGGPGGGVPFTIVATDAVPLDAQGDFQINAQITVPDVCDRPIVLNRFGAPFVGGPFIALSANSLKNNNEDNQE